MASTTGSERAAIAIREDVARVTRGRPMLWVHVHEVAHRLGLADEVAEAAVQLGIENGWFVADGEPTECVRLTADPMQHLS